MSVLSPKPLFNKRRSARHVLMAILKYGLPIGAALLVMSIIFWPMIDSMWVSTPDSAPVSPPQTAEKALEKVAHNAADHPKFTGLDRHDQPYTLVSDYGVQFGEQEVTLTNPVFTTTLKSGSVVTLRADTAYYDKRADKIHLITNVVLTHTMGYTVKTSEAWLDLKEGSAFGDKEVTGQGPAGDIYAPEGFKLWDKGDKIKLLGRSELLIAQKS